MNKLFLALISTCAVSIVALLGFFVWHQTTDQSCYVGIGVKRDLSCIDGKKPR